MINQLQLTLVGFSFLNQFIFDIDDTVFLMAFVMSRYFIGIYSHMCVIIDRSDDLEVVKI